MTWEIVFVVLLLVLAIASFLAEKIPTDQTALSVFVAVVVTVVLMAPVALSLGPALAVDPRPFVIAACIAASASFSTRSAIRPTPTSTASGATGSRTSRGWACR